ncbi:tRNA pseudouridine(55) synthase TruB [Candidatus Aerophobetes bacterium]|uniref:tRNA pseudouridine synthase B n=1 Tax=Aerophobetes bacterium TaxID=2030807 RepID=A0A2A4YIA4_UNCAE|nr:MAG: tRNA pseudouridine(55) synthase TruB [Candidatus Aerophobetes bacterium]
MTQPQKEGILLVNKPRGKTSFYLVKTLRHLTGIKKIGHAGTLDPFATGVMVMLIGRDFTKLSNQFLNSDKEYLARLKLGFTTDSYDCDGVIVKGSDTVPTEEEVLNVIAKFNGEIMQTPPMYSAKKVGGKKLYELARKGIEIERVPQKVELTTTFIEYEYPYLTFQCACTKGTYIRALANDMGKDLGCGAYIEELTRLRSGNFYLEDCVDYNTLSLTNFEYEHHLIEGPWKLSQNLKISKPAQSPSH